MVVTGRPVRWLSQLYDQMTEPVPAVCANGAVVYDPVADEVLRADPMDTDLMIEVIEKLRAAVPDLTLAVEVEDGRSIWHEDTWPVRTIPDHSIRPIGSPEELTSVPAVKLLARSASSAPEEFFELVSRTLGGLAEATHSSSSALAEISAVGVTKAAGLAWLCERHDIAPADVLAFGDMPNDVPMLTWAGRSVAMGNAHPAVLEVADTVAASNEDDGVARFLVETFGL